MATKMSENSKKVFEFLKDNHGQKMVNADIATALSVSAPTVVGSVNGLVKKGLAVRTPVEVTGGDGKTVTIKYIALTDEGLAFDPDATVEA